MKKLFLTLFLAGCITTSFAVTAPATGIAEGNGSAESPYKIGSVAELLFMRDKTNSSDEDAGSYRSASYVLTANLDMADEADWEPISKTSSFGGTFDGNGYAIKNLKFGTSGACSEMSGVDMGLFGVVKYGKILNLKVENVGFYGFNTSEYQIGGIAGSLRAGVVDNCVVSGTLMTEQSNGVICSIGGIAGRINTPNETVSTLIVNSFSDITINVVSTASTAERIHVGGIAGNVSGSTNSTVNSKIVNSYAVAAISIDASTRECYAGGIAGQLTGTDINILISNCYASGDVYVKSANGSVSGIIGRSNAGTATVKNCIALNNSIKFEKNTIPFRVAKNSKSLLFSDNFALGTDFMILQRHNSSSEWTPVVPESNATGEHGETLSGETLEEQIGDALSKLNNYVSTTVTMDEVDLKAWTLKAGNDYPVFESLNTGICNNTITVEPRIVNLNGGIEIEAPGLSDVEIYNFLGQKIAHSEADGSVFIKVPVKGIVIIAGSDIDGKRIFTQKHLFNK